MFESLRGHHQISRSVHDMSELTAKTYEIDGHRVDVVACTDEETPEGEVEFYDFWLRDPAGKSDTHLNEGDPWYPESGAYTPPSVSEVAEYLRKWEPGTFHGKGEAVEFEPERTYRIVLLATITDGKKADEGRGDLDDEEYVTAGLGLAESGLAGMEIVTTKKVPNPPEDCKGKSPLEVMHYMGNWSSHEQLRIMQDFIREIDPEGFASHVRAVADEDLERRGGGM